ncbi:hypothetical protein E2542_SST01426 [Spatholobus suberectus]|nr:hypothetical protein E2542_SST01426 [Spatholobus suberectus]
MIAGLHDLVIFHLKTVLNQKQDRSTFQIALSHDFLRERSCFTIHVHLPQMGSLGQPLFSMALFCCLALLPLFFFNSSTILKSETLILLLACAVVHSALDLKRLQDLF